MGTPKDKDVESLDQANAPEDRVETRRKAETDAAMTPASGAPVQHAYAGAELAAEGRAGEQSETADAIKRAAGNARRV